MFLVFEIQSFPLKTSQVHLQWRESWSWIQNEIYSLRNGLIGGIGGNGGGQEAFIPHQLPPLITESKVNKTELYYNRYHQQHQHQYHQHLNYIQNQLNIQNIQNIYIHEVYLMLINYQNNIIIMIIHKIIISIITITINIITIIMIIISIIWNHSHFIHLITVRVSVVIIMKSILNNQHPKNIKIEIMIEININILIKNEKFIVQWMHYMITNKIIWTNYWNINLLKIQKVYVLHRN